MAKGAYIGVGGVARKVKKGYIGVDGKARKIKKAYIGIGGVARPCWSGGELAYYGTVTAMKYNRAWGATALAGAADVEGGKYAIIAGGAQSSSTLAPSWLDAYDASLTKKSQSPGHHAYMVAAARAGNLAFFAGGFSAVNNEYSHLTTAAYWNGSLTRSTPSYYLHRMSAAGAAGTIGNYAVFHGGEAYATDEDDNDYWYGHNVVTAYNSSGTRAEVRYSNFYTRHHSAASVGTYLIFTQGDTGADDSPSGDAIAVNSSLTVSNITGINYPRYKGAATSVGNYAIFGGGSGGGNGLRVEAYNASLTKTICTNLTGSNMAQYNAATTLGNYAMFSGGSAGGTSNRKTVDVYDASLVKTTTTDMSTARHAHCAITIGNYALFAGGNTTYSDSSCTNTVEAYTIA